MNDYLSQLIGVLVSHLYKLTSPYRAWLLQFKMNALENFDLSIKLSLSQTLFIPSFDF